MNQPFQFDPKAIAQSIEEWQKFWFQGFMPPAKPASETAKPEAVWQNFLNQQTELWQKNLTQLMPMMSPMSQSTVEQTDWQNHPYFTGIQQMYGHACEFIEKQLEMTAKSQNFSEAQKDNLAFQTRQYLAAMNPNNYLMTNPDALKEAFETQGQSLVKGMQNYLTDLDKGRITMSDESSFELGVNLASTPGMVVMKNELIELIQYTPTTEKVYQKPLLIIPPCVNKYYLMDLGAEKSLVAYMVSQGYTVYLVSWRSATEETRHFTWDTYVERGVIAAANAVCNISKQDSINTLGFCIGGLLLSTALCVLKARGENIVDNVIFMTSMADHSEPGDIKYYVTEELVRSREAKMANGGIISGLELQATFSALRPNDLIWNYVQDHYLKGKSPKAFDLLYWNGDSVDLPLPMHTFFLRQFYLNNALTKPGSLQVCGVPIDLADIEIPTYFFAAEGDHIVPWQSVFKGIPLFSGSPERRFVLGESGHIAGAINPVSKDRRSYWTNDHLSGNSDQWLQQAENHPGSWWKDANQWLSGRSGNQVNAPKTFGNRAHKPLYEAPGEYVRAKAMKALTAKLM